MNVTSASSPGFIEQEGSALSAQLLACECIPSVERLIFGLGPGLRGFHNTTEDRPLATTDQSPNCDNGFVQSTSSSLDIPVVCYQTHGNTINIDLISMSTTVAFIARRIRLEVGPPAFTSSLESLRLRSGGLTAHSSSLVQCGAHTLSPYIQHLPWPSCSMTERF